MAGRFTLDLRRFRQKAEARMDTVVRYISLSIFRRLVLRSPVDTGRFRGNWQVEVGKVPDGTLELNDPNGSATISQADATLAGLRAGDTIFIVNNLPYAIPLERGHSAQAPNGMVVITLQEFGAVVQEGVSEAEARHP